VRLQIFFLLALVSSLPAHAEGEGEELLNGSADVLGAFYADNSRANAIYAVGANAATKRIFTGNGQATSLGLGYNRKHIRFEDPSTVFNEQLAGDAKLLQEAYSLNLDQGLAVGTDVGLFAGHVTSRLGKSRWLGARFAQWWREETLQTSVSFRKTTSTQKSVVVYDDDTRQVRLPESLQGENFNLGVRHLTTPTTILIGSYSYTQRSDRPAAQAYSGQVRQFISLTESALFVSLSHYENVGEIKPVSDYGAVVANAVKTEWHQRLSPVHPALEIASLSFAYRYYTEVEDPRGTTAANNELKSDWFYTMLRVRTDAHKALIDASSEVYLFTGRYTNTQPNSGTLVGAGCRQVF